MAQPTLTEINDKLDQLLKYQKRQRVWGWVKTVISLIIFAVVFGAPSYFLYDIYSNPKKYVDTSKFSQYQKQFENLQKQAEQLMKQFQK